MDSDTFLEIVLPAHFVVLADITEVCFPLALTSRTFDVVCWRIRRRHGLRLNVFEYHRQGEVTGGSVRIYGDRGENPLWALWTRKVVGRNFGEERFNSIYAVLEPIEVSVTCKASEPRLAVIDTLKASLIRHDAQRWTDCEVHLMTQPKFITHKDENNGLMGSINLPFHHRQVETHSQRLVVQLYVIRAGNQPSHRLLAISNIQ